MRAHIFLATLLALAAAAPARAQQTSLAPTPPMGWNSWDAYGLTINEQQFRANVDVLAHQLKPFGWTYAVIDAGSYLKAPQAADKVKAAEYVRDDYGRHMPAVNRFPSAANNLGLKPLADYVHSLGLQFGIHIVRGIPREAVTQNVPIAGSTFHMQEAADTTDTCPWNKENYGVRDNAAGQAWYDSLMKQYASWDVDYIKVDCISSHPYKGDEIRMVHLAIQHSGRPMILSLSPGPTPLDKAAEVAANAQLWRISDDFWDMWDKPTGQGSFSPGLKNQIATIAAWEPFAKPGNWPDADMLPVGWLGPVPGFGKARNSLLTPDEQQTLLTMWSIGRSPLILGANLTKLDESTTDLITNHEVLAVDQHSTGNRVAFSSTHVQAWTAQATDKAGTYLAVFNLGDDADSLNVSFKVLGLDGKQYQVRDLWRRQNLGSWKNCKIQIPPHASRLLLLLNLK